MSQYTDQQNSFFIDIAQEWCQSMKERIKQNKKRMLQNHKFSIQSDASLRVK